MTYNLPMVLAGIALLVVVRPLNWEAVAQVVAEAEASAAEWRPLVSALEDVPALARGAVIPPNREFLAVLGDQKSGTNIEAPTSEIEAAVMRGIQRSGINGPWRQPDLDSGSGQAGAGPCNLSCQSSGRETNRCGVGGGVILSYIKLNGREFDVTSLSRPTTGTSMCWMGTMRAASSPV